MNRKFGDSKTKRAPFSDVADCKYRLGPTQITDMFALYPTRLWQQRVFSNERHQDIVKILLKYLVYQLCA